MGEVTPLQKAKPAPAFSVPAPLNAQHELSHFDCGEPALDVWLKTKAPKNSKPGYSRTYVVCEGESTRVVGYYCLASGSVGRVDAPKKMQRNAPTHLPVQIIGRLAVDKAFGGQGLGPDLLSDAFRRIVAVSEISGVSAVMVQAKNERAKAFYLKQAEFLEFPENSLTLFLPIQTLIDALA